MLCVKEERTVTCTITWTKNIPILDVQRLKVSSGFQSLEIAAENSGCHRAVLLCHTHGGISTLSCHPHNQNILQNILLNPFSI